MADTKKKIDEETLIRIRKVSSSNLKDFNKCILLYIPDNKLTDLEDYLQKNNIMSEVLNIKPEQKPVLLKKTPGFLKEIEEEAKQAREKLEQIAKDRKQLHQQHDKKEPTELELTPVLYINDGNTENFNIKYDKYDNLYLDGIKIINISLNGNPHDFYKSFDITLDDKTRQTIANLGYFQAREVFNKMKKMKEAQMKEAQMEEVKGGKRRRHTKRRRPTKRRRHTKRRPTKNRKSTKRRR